MTGPRPRSAHPRPTSPTRPRSSRRALAALVALPLGAVLLAGCAQAEELARGAAEDAAREAVAEATAGVGDVGSEAAREQAQQAVDGVLDSLPGTCADVLAQPASVREEQARAVLRSFWLGELSQETPPDTTVEAFEEAVVDRCDDSRETQASDVIREVWQSGSFAP